MSQLEDAEKYKNITSSATTVVKTGAGTLLAVVVNTAGSSWTATVYDNTAGSGTKIATLSANAQVFLPYGVQFGTGLTVVTAGTTAGDITVVWK